MMREASLTLPQHIIPLPRPGRLLQYARARLYSPEMPAASARLILGLYGLELTGPPENLPLGWRNRNVVVHTDAGKKVLKRYREAWPATTIAYEHSILRRLEEVDFPAPRLVPTRDNKSLVSHNGHNYAVFDFVHGTNFAAMYLGRAARTRLTTKAGATLAQLHRQLAGFLPEGEHHLGYSSYSAGRRRDLAWHLERLATLPEKSKGLADRQAREDARWLSQRSERIAEKLRQLDALLEQSALPRLVIHGDYGIHNLQFEDDGAVTVHDFELARLEWRLVDLVTVLSRLDFESSRHFMAAYQSEYPLSAEEWQCFPYVWQYYRLRGAVQYWHNHFHLGGDRRLAAARQRVKEADWALQHQSKLWRLKYSPDEQSGQTAHRPPRVMMVVRLFYPWIGGTERQAHKLARKLVEKQIPVELVTGWWFRGTPQKEQIDGIPLTRNHTLWHFFDIKGFRKFGGYLYILTLIWHLWRRREEYDVIHVHGLNYHTFASVLAGRWLNRKVVVKLANSGPASDIKKMRQDRQLALARYMLSTALESDRFVALNEAVVRELTAAGVSPQKIIELPNGVEVDDIPARSDYQLDDPARILYVGRLHSQKGLDVLLQAFHLLCQQAPGSNVRLQLVGDGPIREELASQAEQLGIAPRVDFHGKTDKVIAQLQRASIFVLPSRAEGLSNALLEAMSCGLPVVVSNVPGNSDVVEHGVNGLLFTVNDPHSLAECMKTLLDKREVRRRLGEAARKGVEREYSLHSVAERYIALYEEMVADGQVAEGRGFGIEEGP